jgi:hypothetical protein
MLEPQVVVNLLPQLRVGVDLVRHRSWLVKDSRMPREGSSNASAEWSAKIGGTSTRQQPSERARKGETHLSAVCATRSQLDHPVVLASQQHG